MKLILAAIFLFTQLSFADCPEDVQVITKGQVANCDGILLSPAASKKANETADNAKYYKDLSDRLMQRRTETDKEITVLDKRLKLYMDQSQVLAEGLTRKENEDKWQRIVYFSLGVLATGIAVYGAAQITR